MCGMYYGLFRTEQEESSNNLTISVPVTIQDIESYDPNHAQHNTNIWVSIFHPMCRYFTTVLVFSLRQALKINSQTVDDLKLRYTGCQVCNICRIRYQRTNKNCSMLNDRVV